MSNSHWRIVAKTSDRLLRKIPRFPVASPLKARRPARAPVRTSAQRRSRTARQTDRSDKALKPAWCPWPEKPEIDQPDGIRLPIFGGENEEPGCVRTSIARRPGQ